MLNRILTGWRRTPSRQEEIIRIQAQQIQRLKGMVEADGLTIEMLANEVDRLKGRLHGAHATSRLARVVSVTAWRSAHG